MRRWLTCHPTITAAALDVGFESGHDHTAVESAVHEIATALTSVPDLAALGLAGLPGTVATDAALARGACLAADAHAAFARDA
jgi:hypothetical protein